MSEIKVFHPDGPAAPAASAGVTTFGPPPPGPRGAGRHAPTSVRVAEVTAERDPDLELPLPLHLLGPAGEVRVQLRTMLRRVAMGAGLARRPELVAAVRAIPGLPGLVTSPAGGTFIMGGDAWVGVSAIGTPPPGDVLAIDWMLAALAGWFGSALARAGIPVTVGRVDGAWCPGFSDVAAGGRKLAGLGFRATRDWVVMRGVLAVRPMSVADLEILRAVHALVGVEVRGDACTSLAEAGTDPAIDAAGAIALLVGTDAPAVA